jgi:cell division protein FtsI/penicillin-binding protein 2
MVSEHRDNRGEKIANVKLVAVQWGILIMMLALIVGLWRLQVLGADNFRVLAEQNRTRKVPVRRGASSSTARAGWWWTTILRSPASWFASRAATSTPTCR